MDKTISQILRAFSIGQIVRVVDADDVTARVVSIIHNIEGIQYQISYWDGKQRKVEWVFPLELEKID